ncbi:hypothetical protein C8R47DRAFT_1171286 [Mycena vitilis]|nr:hypothetical protein C8R47DRAFT_1171286 [Mycena vitilis]
MSSRRAVQSSVLEWPFVPPQQPRTYSHGYPMPSSHLTVPVSYQPSLSHLSRLSPGQPRPASQHEFPPPRATAIDTVVLRAPTSLTPARDVPPYRFQFPNLALSCDRYNSPICLRPPRKKAFLHSNSTQGPVSYVQKQYYDTAPSPVSTNVLNSRPNPAAQTMTSRSAPAPAHWPSMPTQSSSQSSASSHYRGSYPQPQWQPQSQSQLPFSTDAYPPRPTPASSSRAEAFAPHTSRDKGSVKDIDGLGKTVARADLQRELDQTKKERDQALQNLTQKGLAVQNLTLDGRGAERGDREATSQGSGGAGGAAAADCGDTGAGGRENQEVNELRQERNELRSVCVHGAAQEMKIVPKVEDIKIKLEPEFTPKTGNVENTHLQLQYPHTPLARMDHKPFASTSAQTLDLSCVSSSSSFPLEKNAAAEGKRSRAEYKAEGAVYGADTDTQRAKKRARVMEPSLGPAFPLSPEMARDVVDVKRLNCPLQWSDFMEVRKREE